MPKLDQQTVDQAERIRETLAVALDRVRSDATLSPVGRQQQIARHHQHANTQMQAIRDNFKGGAALTSTDLQRQLFGATSIEGADAISIRDAGDRAAQLETADEAAALLARAEMTGDQHLARAIAARAFEGSQDFIGSATWAPIVDSYVAARPDVGAKLQELSDVQSNTTADALALAGWTYLETPAEINRLTNSQIAGLAEPQE